MKVPIPFREATAARDPTRRPHPFLLAHIVGRHIGSKPSNRLPLATAISRLGDFLSGADGGTQLLRQRLQQFPSDGSVPFDKRAELPEREPMADQVGSRGYGGRAGTAVDQGDLAEVVARAEGGEFDAFARDHGLPGIDDEEGGAPGAFHDDGLALRETAFLEQATDLFGLPAVHAGEELDPLEGGNGIARGTGRRPAVRLARRDRAALQEVEHPILERPFDISARTVDLLAAQSELAQRCELDVVERELIDLRRWHLLLEGASVWQRANRDALAPGLAPQHLTGAIDAKLIGDDEAGDHGLTEAPARFDQALIGAGDRVLGEHDTGDGGVEQRLDDDADAGPGEQADTLAVGDRRVGVRRPPHFADGAGDIDRRMDVEHGEVLPGEACRRAVFVDGRRSDGKRSRQGSDGFRHLFNRLVILRGDGLDQVARERHAGRDREALARGVAEPHRLRPIKRCLARLGEGDDLLHPSTVTSPASPSTRTRTPLAMRPVASRVPTTPGMPYSRETMAACESRPPLSVTIPPSSGRRMLKASVVGSVTSTSPLAIWPNSEGPETRRAGPS